uniref:Uncharacterized protein n=1 Tax=Strigamia maritima TaxID=126957 RepID=T1JD12_STRMM
MNGQMDNNYNWSNNHREGFLSSVQKMMSKLGDILQKTSTKPNNNSPIEMAIDPVELWSSTGGSTLNLDSPSSIWDGSDEDSPEVQQLSRLIESTLREAKDGTLSCGEVLLPAELTYRVARQAFLLAENEPCGLRGCVLLVNYHQDPSSPTSQPRRIGTVQYDPATVATFQLVLTLRKDLNTWTNLRHLLPFKACLRKLGKTGTIIVSPTYTLVKKKLYRSRQE